jgi:hypothetical protein
MQSRLVLGAGFSQPSAQTSLINTSLINTSFSSPRDYGNTLRTAENVGSLKRRASYHYSGQVGGSDLDFFRFRVTHRRRPFSLSLANRSPFNQPIAITVLDQQGKPIQRNGSFLFRNVDAGKTASLSVPQLGRGTFFLRIQSVNGRSERYDLSFALTASLPSSLPTPPPLPTPLPVIGSRTTNIGALQPSRTYQYTGRVGGTAIDLYRFSVNTTSRVSASLFSDRFNRSAVAFSILDRNKRTVQTSNGRFLFANLNPGQTEQLFAPTLSSGEYYLRVQSDAGRNEQYRFSLTRSNVSVRPLVA